MEAARGQPYDLGRKLVALGVAQLGDLAGHRRYYASVNAVADALLDEARQGLVVDLVVVREGGVDDRYDTLQRVERLHSHPTSSALRRGSVLKAHMILVRQEDFALVLRNWSSLTLGSKCA